MRQREACTRNNTKPTIYKELQLKLFEFQLGYLLRCKMVFVVKYEMSNECKFCPVLPSKS